MSCYKDILRVIRSALTENSGLPIESPSFLRSPESCIQLLALSLEQGVGAIAVDGYNACNIGTDNVLESDPALENIKYQWFSSVLQTEEHNKQYISQVKNITDNFYQSGIRTVVLKGLACASYYPIPSHRAVGDFDCYLCGDYEKGNELAELAGAEVDRSHYKHSHFAYQGLSVENHRFCTNIRGDSRKKKLEVHLRELLKIPTGNYVEGTFAEIPCADFNALFLTVHSFQHFLAEGVTLKQLMDWALFLKAEQHNVNWAEFYKWMDYLSLTRFANAMNTLAVEQLGVEVTVPKVVCHSEYADMILEDIFAHNSGVFASGSKWKVRLGLVRNQFGSIWKCHKIYRRSMVVEIIKSAFGVLFEYRS